VTVNTPPDVRAVVPIVVKPEVNQRGHWRARSSRVKAQREAVYSVLGSTTASRRAMRALAVWLNVGGRVRVRMTRIAPRELDDDNLTGAFKSVRDEIASMLGVDDRSKQYEWKCDQQRGAARLHGVQVHIQAIEEGERA
jgi:hypothetical protein